MIQKISVLVMFGIGSVEDVKKKQIHMEWLAFFAAEGILCGIFLWDRPLTGFFSGILPGMTMLLLSYITKGGIGKGDGILLMAAGIFLEAACILRILVYAAFLCAGCALFLCVVKKKNRKYEMPFIPFLLVGYIGELLF